MAVSARLTELEQALLDALCLGESQTNVIREGLRLVWEQRGYAAFEALKVLRPDRADELRQMMLDYDSDDPMWFQTIHNTISAES